MTNLRRVTVLVCGEPMRGDDGLAERIVAALPAATRHMIDARTVGGLMPDDLAVDGPVILVDAIHGVPPGAVVDLPLGDLAALFESGAAPGSSHVLPMPAVLALAQRLGGGLPDGRFIGIGAARFTLGAPISAAVRRAIPPAAARLNHWIRAFVHPRREVAACV
jgi:hydrogenase maturation protease